MTQISLLYFSGYGHTEKQALAVAEGLQQGAAASVHTIAVSPEGDITDSQWQQLDAADAIVLGGPTYMGGVPWQLKKVLDATSGRWFEQRWKNKLAAGFTNSSCMNGDKDSTLGYLCTFAMQQGMVWVGTGMLPAASKAAERNDLNYLGSYLGLMAQSPADASADEGPLPGDLATAVKFGERLAELTQRWTR